MYSYSPTEDDDNFTDDEFDNEGCQQNRYTFS